MGAEVDVEGGVEHVSQEDVGHVSQEGGQQLVGPWRQCVSVGWSASLLRTTLHDAMAPLGGEEEAPHTCSRQTSCPHIPPPPPTHMPPIMPLIEDRIRQKSHRESVRR